MADEWAKLCTAQNGQPRNINNGKYDTIGDYTTNSYNKIYLKYISSPYMAAIFNVAST